MEEIRENEQTPLQLSDCFCLNDFVTYGFGFWIEHGYSTDLHFDIDRLYYCRDTYFNDLFDAVYRHFVSNIGNDGESYIEIYERPGDDGDELVFRVSDEGGTSAMQMVFGPGDYMEYFGVADAAEGILLYEKIDEAYRRVKQAAEGEKA